jgi:hypothetical protein
MPSDHPVVGGVYKRELLESEATYRVVRLDGDHVDVEAIDVPGLAAGHRLRLTAAAVAEMEALSPVAYETGAKTRT